MSAPTPPAGRQLLAGKVVLITAAAGTGVGSAVAERCIDEGATIVASDAHERRLRESAAGYAERAGTEVLALPCDVTVEDQVRTLVDAAVDRHGRIDVLVNNAGLGGTATIVEMTDQQWSTVLDVTLTGTFRMTRSVLKQMMSQAGGVIVNNASVLGWRAQAGQAHYAAAKAGVMALTRTAALEGAPHGIRVNAVAPSLAMHPFLSKVISEEELEDLTGREAFGRAAEPWEVATVVAMLASDYTSYMTGEIVSVSSQHP